MYIYSKGLLALLTLKRALHYTHRALNYTQKSPTLHSKEPYTTLKKAPHYTQKSPMSPPKEAYTHSKETNTRTWHRGGHIKQPHHTLHCIQKSHILHLKEPNITSKRGLHIQKRQTHTPGVEAGKPKSPGRDNFHSKESCITPKRGLDTLKRDIHTHLASRRAYPIATAYPIYTQKSPYYTQKSPISSPKEAYTLKRDIHTHLASRRAYQIATA